MREWRRYSIQYNSRLFIFKRFLISTLKLCNSEHADRCGMRFLGFRHGSVNLRKYIRLGIFLSQSVNAFRFSKTNRLFSFQIGSDSPWTSVSTFVPQCALMVETRRVGRKFSRGGNQQPSINIWIYNTPSFQNTIHATCSCPGFFLNICIQV